MPFALEIPDNEIRAALAEPRQKHNLSFEEVKARLEKLSRLWRLLGRIGSLAEAADFTEHTLRKLEKWTIAFNVC